MKMTKRILTLLLAGCMAASLLVGCAPKEEKPEASKAPESKAPVSDTADKDKEEKPAEEEKKDGPLFEKTEEFDVMIPSHGSWPYQEGWYIQNAIETATNTKLHFQAVPISGGAYGEKVNIMMAGGELPDLIFDNGFSTVKNYWNQGALANIYDYSDYTPNFNAFKAANEAVVKNYITPDGGLYMFPEYGIDETNRRIMMYRKDVFDKLGLEVPTDAESFYNVLKALKAEYPDSYPFAFRSKLNILKIMGPMWGTGDYGTPSFGTECTLNEEGKYEFSPIQPEFKEMVEFFAKLYKEGLILPNFLSIDTKGWQDVMSNSQAFVTHDYISRIDFFNLAMRESNPEYNLQFMAPPAVGKNGKAQLAYSAIGRFGYMVGSTSKKIEKVMQFMDWFYTEEGRNIVSWGTGDLYTEANGERKWNDLATTADLRKETGISTYGMYLLYDFDSHITTFTDDIKSAYEEAYKYDAAPQPCIALTEEEDKEMVAISTVVMPYVQEALSKFIIGEKSMDEWDAYVAEVKKLGSDRMCEISDAAYNR